MNTDVQRIRTAIITSKLVGPIVRWGWKRYVTAIALSAPDDCAEIPKVPDAGRRVTDLNGPCQVMHNGIKVRLGAYYDDLNTLIIEKLRGHHEPQEELVFHKVLQRLPQAPVMIEAGSYWGYYSLWFKKQKPQGSVFLIEPVDARLEIGKCNFRINNFKGEFVRAYVGATSKPAHSVKMEGAVIRDVEMISIDDFMKRHGLPHVHLLHADVQGAEVDLLKGAECALTEGKLSYIFISTHGTKVHEDCIKLLTQHKFRIIASHTRAQSFTTDGLIVAKNGAIEGLDEVPISKKHGGVLQDLRLVARHIFSSSS